MSKRYCKEAFERADKDRQERVLEVGIEEFAKNGYEKANINIIAKRAGISIGLMYKYFETKEDLFITCLRRGMEILERALNEIMISEDKLLDKAEKLIKTISEHSRANRNYIKMYNEISSEKWAKERIKELAEEIESRRSKIYTETISEARESGDIRKDIEPRMLAYFLDGLMTTLQFSYSCDYYREKLRIYTGVDINEAEDEEVTDRLLRFVESAFSCEREEKK